MNFTDTQVLTLIRTHPGSSLYGLLQNARLEMKLWPWTIGKIQKAVERLEKDAKITKTSTMKGGRACVELYLKS